MYILSICNAQLSENVYDIRLELSKKNELCDQYKLQNKGEHKEYWENNVCIVVSEKKSTFDYIEDLTISYNMEKNHLYQETNTRPCIPYNFYNVDNEEIYTLYENESEKRTVQVKEFSTYLTLTFKADKLKHLESE